MNGLLRTALLTLAVTPLLYGQTRYDATIIAEDPFSAFKQDIVETGCVVARIDKFPPYGATAIGAEGGAKISDREAVDAYNCALPALRQAHGESGFAPAAEYLDWQRFSTGPYESRAHSRRYVSNYANAIAAEFYGRWEAIDKMPVGSILAKNSLIVTPEGRVGFGSLAILEKMPAGFNPDTGDWRFTLVLPDGRLFGQTNDDDQVAVKFCADCHQDAGPKQDFLFFMPQRYRIER